jgi:hypothetical protein
MRCITDQHDSSSPAWLMHHLLDGCEVKLLGRAYLTHNVTHRLGEVVENVSEALDPSLRRIRNGSGRDPIGVAVHAVATYWEDKKRTPGTQKNRPSANPRRPPSDEAPSNLATELRIRLPELEAPNC